MSTFNKWVRQVHRWLAIPLLAAISSLIFLTIQQGPEFVSPGWLNNLGLFSILSMVVTGVYLFAQHYIARLRRSLRSKKRAGVPAAEV